MGDKTSLRYRQDIWTYGLILAELRGCEVATMERYIGRKYGRICVEEFHPSQRRRRYKLHQLETSAIDS